MCSSNINNHFFCNDSVSRQLKDVIRELLLYAPEVNLDLDILDIAGDTALHLAARRGNQDIVELLCDGGADPRILSITAKKRDLEDELNVVESENNVVTYSMTGEKLSSDAARNYNLKHSTTSQSYNRRRSKQKSRALNKTR
eukprot:gene7343-14987_t